MDINFKKVNKTINIHDSYGTYIYTVINICLIGVPLLKPQANTQYMKNKSVPI